MRILFVGDIMGRAGREALEVYLPGLKRDLAPDVVIVNGENAAHGKGITDKICQQFYALGVDVITSGNHIWDQREIIPYIARDPKLLRPANFPDGTPGAGINVHTLQDGRKIAVVNLMARLFMDALDDPFALMEKILRENVLGNNGRIHSVLGRMSARHRDCRRVCRRSLARQIPHDHLLCHSLHPRACDPRQV